MHPKRFWVFKKVSLYRRVKKLIENEISSENLTSTICDRFFWKFSIEIIIMQ